MKLSALLIFAAALANGQIDRTLHFLTAPPPAALEEAATLLRTVGGIGQLRLDPLNPAIDIRGSASEILLAEWLVNQLDRPGGPPTREYRLPGNQDDVIRVAFLANNTGARDLQELLTTLRTVAGLQRIAQYNAAHAIAWRGKTAEANLAAWLIRQLDTPAGAGAPGAHQYTGNGDDVTRVFFSPRLQATQDREAVLAATRAKLRITRSSTSTGAAAVVLRDTAARIERAAQLIESRQ